MVIIQSKVSILLLVIFSIALSNPSRLSHKEICIKMGFLGEDRFTDQEIENFKLPFHRLDTDNDNFLTWEEYKLSNIGDIEKKKAIFAATDRNNDGKLSEQEYVENRIITEEAKIFIFPEYDTNNDSAIIETELLENTQTLFSEEIAREVFEAFDLDSNNNITIPEFLNVWGDWARESLSVFITVSHDTPPSAGIISVANTQSGSIIMLTVPSTNHYTLLLYDVRGIVVHSVLSKTLNRGNHTFAIQNNHIAKGLYLITLQSKTQTFSKRIFF